MKHTTHATMAAVAGASLVAMATLAAAPPAAAQTTLKFSHTDQQAGARQAAATLFARKVEELTQGRYKVQVFCCSQLGNDPKNIEQLALGGIDFTVSATGSYAPHIPSLNLTMMPFLVDNYRQGWKLYDESKWLQAQFDKAPAKGFRSMDTVWVSGPLASVRTDSYMGASGWRLEATDERGVTGIAVDGAGNAYVTGATGCALEVASILRYMFGSGSSSVAGSADMFHANPLRRLKMQWTTPAFTDMRFGFEITMYIANR